MGPEQLAAFAAGYLEAIADQAAELARLREECARQAGLAAAWRAEAGRAWDETRCNRDATRRALEGIDTMAARAEAAAGRTETTTTTTGRTQ